MSTVPEPKRILQYFSWEDQERWQHVSPEKRLEWLEFVVQAAWAGAARTALERKRLGLDESP